MAGQSADTFSSGQPVTLAIVDADQNCQGSLAGAGGGVGDSICCCWINSSLLLTHQYLPHALNNQPSLTIPPNTVCPAFWQKPRPWRPPAKARVIMGQSWRLVNRHMREQADQTMSNSVGEACMICPFRRRSNPPEIAADSRMSPA